MTENINTTIESKKKELPGDVREILQSAKIPDKEKRDKMDNYAHALILKDLSEEEREQRKQILEEISHLYESEYIDQRDIFKEEKVVNKNFVKEVIKEQIEANNYNFL